MHLSLNWLQQYVEVKEKPDKVAEIFTLTGFEVEQVIPLGKELEDIIVGQVQAIDSHPNADKLTVCSVDIGTSRRLSIVCGAKNIKPGHKVPVARVGVTLPNGLKIEKRDIRGAASEGMLCAEDELELGRDHSGIMVLPAEAAPGQPLPQALKINDTVLDISVSPNRPDGFSILGLAREYAALTGRNITYPKVSVKQSSMFTADKEVSIQVADPELCPHYTARVVKSVDVRQSPLWLQGVLRAAGLKPINNIVDVANYVMLEYGQPLHAFDLDRVNNRKVVVRRAGNDKHLITLDDEARQLQPDMLVIADDKQPIAVAGVIGGKNSEILTSTNDVLIESALFKPVSIRKTRQSMGIVTEASTRFEKGLWPGLAEQAADRAAQLMAELADGQVAKGVITVAKQKKTKPTIIFTTAEYISGLIGHAFTAGQIKKYLEKLYFKISSSGKQLRVVVPAFRPDVTIPADLVEEVGRIHGWNKIKPEPIIGAIRPPHIPEHIYWTRKIKRILMACGMTEVLNYSFYSEALRSYMPDACHYEIENPINPEQKYLRVSLLPQLFMRNKEQYQEREVIKIYEVGNVYYNKQSMPDEQLLVAGTVYDKTRSRFQCFQEVKSIIQKLVQQLQITIQDAQYIKGDNNRFVISVNNNEIGICGIIPEDNTQSGKTGNPKAFFQLNMQILLSFANERRVYTRLSRYPVALQDLTFFTPSDASYEKIVKIVKDLDTKIISDFRAIGQLYKKPSEKEHSATFRLTLQSPDHTLTSDEIEAVRHKVISALEKKFNMKLKQ